MMIGYLTLAAGLAIGLTTSGASAANSAKPDRSVSVRWLGSAGKNLKVKVVPATPLIETPLGVRKEARFRFQNVSDRPVSFKAIHNVDPGQAEKYVSKTVCFCFSRQTLKPREIKELPIWYTINEKLPSDISDMVISYSLVPS